MRIILVLPALLTLASCYSIPQAPQRDHELFRQCTEWNNYKNLELNKAIEDSLPSYVLLDISNELVDCSEAALLWVGRPEKPFRGEIEDLLLDMQESHGEYRRELTEWREEVSNYTGMSLVSPWASFKWVILTLFSVLLIVFIVARRMY